MNKIEHSLLDASKKAKKEKSNLTDNVTTMESNDLTSWATTKRQIESMDDARQLSHKECDKKRIIYPEMKDKKLVNSFRDLRTKLLSVREEANFITMVTSLYSEGGSSFTSLNLAASIAFDQGKTSIIIDCNLKDAHITSILEHKDSHGLTDFLEGSDTTVEEIIHSSGIARLRCLPIGKNNESSREYFTSLGMKRLISHIKERYHDRFPILDSPPILESADAKILAHFADKILLVVPYGKVSQDEIQMAVDAIGAEKLAGIVINNEPR